MIPTAWVAVVLGLAVFRLARLAGWDVFPPVVKLRERLLGESVAARSRPGGQNDVYVTSYRRPVLAELVHCAFCLSFWLAVVAYGAWLWQPTWTLYAAFPLALNAFAGLVAKALDP